MPSRESRLGPVKANVKMCGATKDVCEQKDNKLSDGNYVAINKLMKVPLRFIGLSSLPLPI